MVSDSNNKTFTELYIYLKTIYKITAGQDISKTPSKFPYMYFFQIDASTAARTLSNTEDAISVAYQIETYSKNGMNDARKIAWTIRDWMIAEGFECVTFMPFQSESEVSRFIARYERLEV